MAIESYKQNFKVDANNEFVELSKGIQQYIQDLYQMNIDKCLADRKFYIVFNSIFTIDIAHEIKKNAPILRELIKRLELDSSEQEIMMNLQHFILEENKSQDYTQYISTLLKLFYDEDLLTEDYLISWGQGQPADS